MSRYLYTTTELYTRGFVPVGEARRAQIVEFSFVQKRQTADQIRLLKWVTTGHKSTRN